MDKFFENQLDLTNKQKIFNMLLGINCIDVTTKEKWELFLEEIEQLTPYLLSSDQILLEAPFDSSCYTDQDTGEVCGPYIEYSAETGFAVSFNRDEAIAWFKQDPYELTKRLLN